MNGVSNNIINGWVIPSSKELEIITYFTDLDYDIKRS